jgi:Protein of unknown function (DUF1501)
MTGRWSCPTCGENPLTRRQAISRMGAGFGGLALAALLAEESCAANNPLTLRPTHFPPRVKRVIMLFMFGGPSHLDTFDPKPILTRHSGRPLPELDLIARMDRRQAQNREPETELDARISSFELAFRLQAEAPEMLEIAHESKATQNLYGLDDPATTDFGSQCLMARRLSERGVRFVQCNLGGWDSQSNLKAAHSQLARAIDKPIFA